MLKLQNGEINTKNNQALNVSSRVGLGHPKPMNSANPTPTCY